MTIAGWNIVFNATICGLLVAYGIWLRKIVKQQLNAKDSTIEALKTAIKSHEVQIARLKDESAPVIADAYQKMRKHADQMTQDSERLRQDLAKSRAEMVGVQNAAPKLTLLAEGIALKEASEKLLDALQPYFSPPTPPTNAQRLTELIDSVMAALGKIILDAQAKLKRVSELPK